VADGTAVESTGARKPRYVELADDLRKQILGGELEVDAFPTESMLCSEYSVSRFTVREALRILQAEGLIARRRGSGTVIQSAAARGGALHQPLSNVGEILQYARDTRFAFHRAGTVRLPKKLAEEIGCPAGGSWARFRGIRTSADGTTPIAATDAYVHPDLAAAADQIDTRGNTIFRQLEQLARVRIARVTQDIQAVAATRAVADGLKVSRRSPCLRILRCYLDENGRILEISASHHPGESFAYSMHIEVER
jgi:DNA-binding GntR family transcriptional regulator